jgi:tetratricopeptide (TPR) repeat protein
MTSFLRWTVAALAFASTVSLAAMPAAADDFETCGRAYDDQAITTCTRAIDSGRYGGPELAFLFSNRCLAWIKRRGSDKAIEDCSQAIQLNPNDARAFFTRALAYQLKGEFDRAIEDYDQAIRIDPNCEMAFYNRAGSYLHRALADFKKYSELAPSDSDGPKAVERVTKALKGQ